MHKQSILQTYMSKQYDKADAMTRARFREGLINRAKSTGLSEVESIDIADDVLDRLSDRFRNDKPFNHDCGDPCDDSCIAKYLNKTMSMALIDFHNKHSHKSLEDWDQPAHACACVKNDPVLRPILIEAVHLIRGKAVRNTMIAYLNMEFDTLAQFAELLNAKPATVRQNVRRGCERLRPLLTDHPTIQRYLKTLVD